MCPGTKRGGGGGGTGEHDSGVEGRVEMRRGGEVGHVSLRHVDLPTWPRFSSVVPSSWVTIPLRRFPWSPQSPTRVSRSSPRSPMILMGISLSLPLAAIAAQCQRSAFTPVLAQSVLVTSGLCTVPSTDRGTFCTCASPAPSAAPRACPGHLGVAGRGVHPTAGKSS